MFLLSGHAYINEWRILDSVSVDLYSYACIVYKSLSLCKQCCQLWRCCPSIETVLGEFPVSARVLALMPATAHMFLTLGS